MNRYEPALLDLGFVKVQDEGFMSELADRLVPEYQSDFLAGFRADAAFWAAGVLCVAGMAEGDEAVVIFTAPGGRIEDVDYSIGLPVFDLTSLRSPRLEVRRQMARLGFTDVSSDETEEAAGGRTMVIVRILEWDLPFVPDSVWHRSGRLILEGERGELAKVEGADLAQLSQADVERAQRITVEEVKTWDRTPEPHTT